MSAGNWAYPAEHERGMYGPPLTYELAAKWLEPCAVVEDWGCGLGGFGLFRMAGFVGIDGSPGPYTDIVVDLTAYQHETPGLLMRHVLEHNYGWAQILDNACSSFTYRMALVLFTPLLIEADIAEQVAWVDAYQVPDLALPLNGLTSIMDEHHVHYTYEQVDSNAGYGKETVFYMSKHPGNKRLHEPAHIGHSPTPLLVTP